MNFFYIMIRYLQFILKNRCVPDVANNDHQSEHSSESDENEELEGEKIKNQLISDILLTEKICHTTSYKIALSDVTYTTMKNNILATNHIIMAGLVSNLVHFIMPLRSKCLSRYPPIVILNDEAPSEKQWNQIAFFPEIYFVQGNALNESDLHRVNIKKASKVVLLSTSTRKGDFNKPSSDNGENTAEED